MKQLLWPLMLFTTAFTFAQKLEKLETVTDHSIHIVTDKFEGIIFKENFIQNLQDSTEYKTKKFTLSFEDLVNVEKILSSQNKLKKSTADAKYIFNNLKEYRRQYIGFFDKHGKKMVYVNCFEKHEEWADKKIKYNGQSIPTWYNTLFRVFDGGKSFWQITINLETGAVVSFYINGVA